MSFFASVARARVERAYKEPRTDTAGSVGAGFGSSVLRLSQPAATRDRASILQLYGRNGWVRRALETVSARQSPAEWKLYAPATKSRREALGVKVKALCARSGQVADVLRAVRREGDLIDIEEEYGPHPFLTMLRLGVPGQFDGATVAKLSALTMMLLGEAVHVLIRDRNGAGVPALRFPIPPTWMTPPQIGGGGAALYNFTFGLEAQRPENMDWWRNPDPSNPYARGSGVIEALDHDVAIDEEAKAALLAQFRNSMRPDLLVAGTFNSRQADELEEKFRAKAGGSEHRGVSYFLSIPQATGAARDAFHVHDLNRTPADMQTAELSNVERDTILMVSGVPPAVVGQTESSNRATATMAEVFIRRNSTIPALEAIRRHLQSRYLEPWMGRPPEYGGETRLVLAYSLPELVDEERLDLVLKEFRWVFDGNEIRSLVGYGSRDELRGIHAVPTDVTLQPMSDVLASVPAQDEPEKALDASLGTISDAWAYALEYGLDAARARFGLNGRQAERLEGLVAN